MFGYRRKRNLGCEQLEGRFAPSSFWVGGVSRSTFKDAQALETAQAEQAASYLAASAVLSQSSSVANVAPITFDQPAAGEVESKGAWDGSGFFGVGQDGFLGYCVVEPIGTPILYWWIEIGGDETPQPADDGTESEGQNTGDTEVTHDIPSVDPVSPEMPFEQGNDADPVGAVPSEELPAGDDDVAAEDFPPVVDDILVAGDDVADPVVDGGRKRRRGDRVAAVQNGGAQPCSSLGGEDRGDSPDHTPFQREAQECTATWRSGARYDVRC